MDFNAAILAHSAWKRKLTQYLAKPDKSIDPAELEKDDRCDLGRWIYSEGKKLASDPTFKELTKEHADFHKAAADVVRRANAGKSVSEEVALGARSPYARATTAVVHALSVLKQKSEQLAHK